MYVQHQRPGTQLWEQLQEFDPFNKRQLPNGLPAGFPDRFTLTGPITITITRQATLSLPTTTLESISLTSVLTTSTNTPSSSSLPPSVPPTTSQPSPTVITPSRTPASSTRSPTPTNINDGTALQNNAATSSAITGGAIAGIVISCLFLVGVVGFFVWRSHSRKKRRKSRAIWATSTTLKMPPAVSNKDYPSDYLSDTRPYQFSAPAMSEKKALSPTRMPPKRVPVPEITPERPSSEVNGSGLTSPYMSTFNSGTILSTQASQKALKSPPPQSLSPFAAKVVSTFIRNLPDELEIKLGEVVRLLAEYSDGWALCMNSFGEQGMVPMDCLDRAYTGDTSVRQSIASSANPTLLPYLITPLDPSSPGRRGSNRLSSLDPTSQPLKTYPSL